jgi:hypothetical protein
MGWMVWFHINFLLCIIWFGFGAVLIRARIEAHPAGTTSQLIHEPACRKDYELLFGWPRPGKAEPHTAEPLRPATVVLDRPASYTKTYFHP